MLICSNIYLCIEIEFEHPTAAGMCDWKTFPVTFGLQTFISAMADELNLPPRDIQLAYHLPTKPKSTVPHHLATDENWDRMLGDVQQAQVAEGNKVPTKCQKVHVLITQAKRTESGGAVKGLMKVCEPKVE